MKMIEEIGDELFVAFFQNEPELFYKVKYTYGEDKLNDASDYLTRVLSTDEDNQDLYLDFLKYKKLVGLRTTIEMNLLSIENESLNSLNSILELIRRKDARNIENIQK